MKAIFNTWVFNDKVWTACRYSLHSDPRFKCSPRGKSLKVIDHVNVQIRPVRRIEVYFDQYSERLADVLFSFLCWQRTKADYLFISSLKG